MISVVIGIYNGEKYLSDCIDSVLAQTFEEVQIVLVDDKSSDRSLCIAQEYASRHPGKIKLIAQEENRGAGNTWNTGIQAADGEYVMMLGDDDWLDPDLCEKIHAAASHGKPDIVFTGKRGWIEERSILYKPFPKGCLGEMTDEKKKTAMIHLANDLGFVIAGAYRKAFLTEQGLSFPLISPEDIPVTLLFVACAKKTGMVEDGYYNYRIHEESIVHRKNSELYLNIHKAGLLMRQNFIDRELYGAFHEEVEFAFLLSAYYFTVYNAMARYDERPVGLMRKVRDIVLEVAPDWKKNAYIPLCWDRWKFELLRLNEESPQRLADRFPDCDAFIKKARNGELKTLFGDGGYRIHEGLGLCDSFSEESGH